MGHARTCCASSTSPPERVHVIHNGIDADFYRPDRETDCARAPRHRSERCRTSSSSAASRGRRGSSTSSAPSATSTRASASSSAPDSRTRPRSPREMERRRRAPRRRERPNVVWIGEMVSREEVRQLYSHAAVFCCPSVYEPFGIINLEAAACETPVVASAVGGHPGGRRRRRDRPARAGGAVARMTRCRPSTRTASS